MSGKLFEKSFGLFILCLLLFNGCKKYNHSASKQEDWKQLVSLKAQLDRESASVTCENGTDWQFIAIGAKACGGPTGYIPYSNKIDVPQFLEKVELYTEKEKAFNIKWNIVSDCMFLSPPQSIECVNGKTKLVY